MRILEISNNRYLLISEYWIIIPAFLLIDYIIIHMILRLKKYIQNKNNKNSNKNNKDKFLKRLHLNKIRGGQEFVHIEYKENQPIKELKYRNKEKVQKIILNYYTNIIKQNYRQKVKDNIINITPIALHKIIKELKFLPIFLSTVYVDHSISHLLYNSPSSQLIPLDYKNQVLEQNRVDIIELGNLNFENESGYKIKIPSKSDEYEYILPLYIFKECTDNNEIFKNQNNIKLDYENILCIYDYLLHENSLNLKENQDDLNKYKIQHHHRNINKAKPKSTTVNFLDKFKDGYVSENETWNIDTNSIEHSINKNSSKLIKLQKND